MFTTIKEKAKQVWEKIKGAGRWIKRNTKKVLVTLGIVGTALAITIPQLPEQIPVDFQLKGKVLESREVGKVVCDQWEEIDSTTTDDKVKSCKKTKIEKFVKYDYISDRVVPKLAGESISKRTGNAQFFKIRDFIENGIKKEEWTGKFYVGTPFFYIPHENKWYQTETATTTIDAFEEQMKVSFFQKLLGRQAFALSTSSPIGVGDGYAYVNDNDSQTWDYVHDDDGSDDDAGAIDNGTVGHIYNENSGNGFDNSRGFFPVDTSGLPSGAVVTAATTSLHNNNETDGSGWWNIVGETTQADPTALVAGDYDNCGLVDDPDEGATRIDVGSIGVGAWSYWIMNATGMGWINDDGYTMLGLRHENDSLDNEPTERNYINVRMSEYAATTYDPYLEITYTEAVAEEVIVPGIIELR